MRCKETSASEPLKTCRKVHRWRQNRVGFVSPGEVWEIPVYCPDGVRHEGGVTLLQALVWNVGTCRPDVKGSHPSGSTMRIRVPMRGTGAELRVVAMKGL